MTDTGRRLMSTVEPTQITAGMSASWARADIGYAPGEWVLKYAFLPADGVGSRVDITTTAVADVFVATLTSEASATLKAGGYVLFGYVENGAERYKVYEGKLTVEANPLATQQTDRRAWLDKVIAALEESILGVAKAEHQSISIGGKTIVKMSLKEKIDARDHFRAERAQLNRKNRSGIRTILAVFK